MRYKASEVFKAQIVEMIKAVNNQGLGYPKVVLLGTTANALEMVALDEGVDRLVKETRVDPMTPDEAGYLIREGMTRLNIRIGDDLVDQIIETAVGAPGLIHEICLDTANAVLGARRDEVEAKDVSSAVRRFLVEHEARLTAKWIRAIEHTGPR